MPAPPSHSRRAVLATLAALGASAALARAPARADAGRPAAGTAGAALTRPFGSSGPRVPVIGLGTWITFNVGTDERLIADRVSVMRAFFERGGGLIDSSPMYGSSEAVIGKGLARLDNDQRLFSATKVWTWRTGAGPGQMAESRKLWGVARFDLMQVHNLLSWEGHLETLRADKEAGRVRFIGITTSHGARHAEMARIMETQPIDAVQFSYNVRDREAEARLLPLAAERGLAVIVNRPFRTGDLFRVFDRHPLPSWAAEIGCANWAQVMLKFVVSHPAVTCAIPATSRLDHLGENMGALRGPLPDAALRRRMVRDLDAL